MQIQSKGDELLFAVRVAPRASRTAVAGPHGEALKISLSAPPVDGEANKALIAFIAKQLGVAKRQVRIARGERGRDKLIAVSGVRLEDLRAWCGGTS